MPSICDSQHISSYNHNYDHTHISVKDLYHPITMSTAANSYYFRRRTMGRAASPPTWACYEQIHNDDDNSDSDSCSEDDEDYNDGDRGRQEISDP